ncbi:MAG TPA: UDP-glucose 4-epimerase GalE [Micromonosporaceae bacterium]
MKVLVTGGAGYIGSVVAHALVDAGHEVEIVDDLSTGFEENIPAAATLHKQSVHQIGDVLRPGAGFDAVLHFAGKIEVAESVVRPDFFWHTNVAGTTAVLDAMRAARTPKLIFSSTGSLYRADPDGAPLTEESVVDPANPYAATKLSVDLMLAGEAVAFGLAAASLRYFNAAGAVGSLGERHDPESHLIPIMLQAAAGRRDEVFLYGTDWPTADGTCIRDYIHVADLASAHLLALEAIEPGRHEVFNLGNGQGHSNRQVIESVERVSGRTLPLREVDRRPGDNMISVASSEKARRMLGWTPQHPDLDDIIGDAWAFHEGQS